MMNNSCLICGKMLKCAGPDPALDSPLDATVFISYGNFGSTLWDPLNREEYLQVAVCDKCLTFAAQVGRVLHAKAKIPARPVVEYKVWNDTGE